MMTTADLADRIIARIDGAVRGGATPQIILDLDGTLFDNVPRTKVILEDAARHLFGPDDDLASRIAGIRREDFEYAPADTLRKVGVEDEDLLEALREEWASRFFGSDYLRHDEPLAGAVQAACIWWERGAALNYVTGRHVPEMLEGTTRSLVEAGFPMGARARLHLKPRYDLDDVAFKVDIAPTLGKQGPVTLVVDNDPRVINTLAGALPDALAVMVRTLHPRDAPAPDERVILVDDFRALVAQRSVDS